MPGEKTHPYQPDLEFPEPFGRTEFKSNHFWSYNDEKLNQIKLKYKNHKFGFFETYELGKINLQYNMNGGAEWMGGSVDVLNQKLYVTANNIPWETEVIKLNKDSKYIPEYKSTSRALDDKGYPISKPPWEH